MGGKGMGLNLMLLGMVTLVLFFALGMMAVAAAFVGTGGGGSKESSGASGGAANFENCSPNDKIFAGIPDQATGLAAHANGFKEAPAKWLPLYNKAAGKNNLGDCGAAVVAGIHAIETRFGGSSQIQGPPTPYGRAQGPLQFLESTWATQGQDCNNDGKKSPYDIEDAICGAANYLGNSGAPGNYKKAVFAYNRDNSYVEGVMALAKRFAGAGK